MSRLEALALKRASVPVLLSQSDELLPTEMVSSCIREYSVNRCRGSMKKCNLEFTCFNLVTWSENLIHRQM